MFSSTLKLRDGLGLMVEQKLVRLLGGRPWIAALIVAAGLFSSFHLLAVLFGIYEFLTAEKFPDIESTLGMDPYTWAAFVTSLLTGFGISASSFALMHDDRDLRTVAPVLGREPGELIDTWIAFQGSRLIRARIVSVVFFTIGVVVVFNNIPGTSDLLGIPSAVPLPWFQQVPAAWFLIVVPLNFAVIGKSAYFTVAEETFLQSLRLDGLEIVLFEPERLKPFNRMALRRSLLWIVGSSIGLLFFLSPAIQPERLGPFLIAIMLVAFATLLLPLYGIHRKIRETKQVELGVVRALIVELKDELIRPHVGGGDAAQRLMGVIAYEARLERVSDWSIDLPTMGKFSLYLAIPVFSWVGGALVERVVDAVL